MEVRRTCTRVHSMGGARSSRTTTSVSSTARWCTPRHRHGKGAQKRTRFSFSRRRAKADDADDAAVVAAAEVVYEDENLNRESGAALDKHWRGGCLGLRRAAWFPERFLPKEERRQEQQSGGFWQLGRLHGAGLCLASLVLLDLVLAHPSQALTLDHLMQVPHSLATQGLYVPGLVGDDEFREGFTSGLLLILVSEIGDKTFFVAMLLAVRQSDNSGGNQQSLNSNNNNSNSDGLALKGESSLLDKATERRLVVYVGTVAALGLMTIISCVIGRSFHSLDQMFADYIPSGLSALPLDDLAAVVLLTSFGITSLKDARALDDKEQQQADDGTRRGSGDVVFDIRDEEDSEEEAAKALVQEMKDEGKISEEQGNGSLLWQSFLLVFAAEWGDRSFLSTIALTAAYPPVAVVAGATSGHAVATALAVGGGSVLAKYISEKAIAYSAGVLFLAFAAATVVDLMV